VGRGGLLGLVLLAWANRQGGPAGLQLMAPGAGERALPSGRLAGRAADGGAWRSAQCGSVRAGAKGSSRGGPRLGHCHGPTQAHSADFDLNKDF
jgi:hypothetical protein